MAARRSGRVIRVGVIGVGRGQAFARGAGEAVGMKLVAVCDTWKQRLGEVATRFKVTGYTDYDKFLAHDMDAVILANYFHQHAPFAIQALHAGKHVLSETAANSTLADGVALCRAVEKTGKTYMLAENYPFTAFNQEMRRLYQSGEIGRIMYAEGEYNHPMSPRDRLQISPGMKHWRSWIPSTYYCTHALAPLMYITRSMPKTVIGLSMPARECDDLTVRVGDPGGVILTRNDDGSVFRILGLLIPGHSCWYRLHGTRGAMETVRGPGYFGPGQVRIWHEEWDRDVKKTPADRVYTPDWPEHAELARKAGHGGGDFWTNFHFANAIRTGKPPFLDVYRAVNMSSVGILGWRSAVRNGAPQEMPDFREESQRKRYESDHWSPWPDGTGDGQAPPSVLGWPKPSRRGIANAKKVWREIGYKFA